MISNFFQLTTLSGDHYLGFYDYRLVILSFLVAMSASYVALDITGRLREISNTIATTQLWLIGGAIAMGSGIWSMHFIGMLSFSIPGLTFRYDIFWTVLSLVVAILASGFALYLFQVSKIRIEHYIVGGIILGLAIASMHYTGMEALLITLNIRYLPTLFFISILIAIVASEAALWFAMKSDQVIQKFRTRIKIVSASVMGIAICGMHYTGMAASVFTPLCVPSLTKGTGTLDPALLSMNIAAVTFIILGIAFFASTYKEALVQQQFEKARQLGMAEISSSVLHNVGNVLNSVKVSADIVTEKNASSKLVGLEKLSNLLLKNQQDLTAFLTKDPHGSQTIEFITALAEYWREEQKAIGKEMEVLTDNVNTIKEIIMTEQDLSKMDDATQTVAINRLLDEALLITGFTYKMDIAVEKNYTKIKPIKINKVKLLQALINILRNAKDAVNESSNKDKIILIETEIIKNKVFIKISDNGIGIEPKNLNKLFIYGFTTKKSGHGFGLHNSAIAISEMGGKITVSSQQNQKTTFMIELSYFKERDLDS
jgi:NO-binding membrane sensor protein with MHYT domain